MAQSRGPVDFSALPPGVLRPAPMYSPLFTVHPGDRILVLLENAKKMVWVTNQAQCTGTLRLVS